MYSFVNSFRCLYLPAVLAFCLCLSVTNRLGAEVAEQDIEVSPQDRQRIAAASSRWATWTPRITCLHHEVGCV